ncbi:MAG: DUF2062 domain-containing protein [Burkholderiaceae bacterium]|nr:DUF2062 domain-containing protein [Burkholderiaceae bacterium]
MKAFKRYLPDRERIARNRWLRWLGPSLLHPRLWHFSRRGVAVGVAVGVFFGLLVPIAQIPMAAGVAIVLRANVPTAVSSTLITNPFTFAPIYLLAYQVGATMLGEEAPDAASVAQFAEEQAAGVEPDEGFWNSSWKRITALGRPLIVGLATLAIGAGALTYVLIMLVWRIRTVMARRRRQRPRAPRD